MSRDIGDPPRLPLRLAVRVAWTSIRVRLSRSLVTVSSVVLAVAFLLVVVGENVANHAVWIDFVRERQPTADLEAVRRLAHEPRRETALLALLADHGDEARAWAHGLGVEVPPVDATAAKRGLAMVAWLGSLKPSQRYLLIRNRSPAEWLAGLDPAQADAFARVAKQLPGVRPPLPREDLAALAASGPALHAALSAMAAAEDRRIAAIGAAGGAEALLDRILAGSPREALTGAGLPLAQELPGLDDRRWAALREQLRLDRARARAVDVVRELNDRDPAAVGVDDIRDWDAFAAKLRAQAAEPGDNPGKRLVQAAGDQGPALAALIAAPGDPARREAAIAAIDAALARAAFYSREAWTGIELPDQAGDLTRRDQLPERALTRLDRALFDAAYAGLVRPVARASSEPLELPRFAEGAQRTHRLAPALTAALPAALGDVTPDELWRDLRRRAKLEALDATFTGIAYDPVGSAARTFWLVALSLLVCIVGIVNTMMMAVTERFREIATMKCLGAMDSFILKAFLIESGATGVVGSLVGAVIGLVLALTQAGSRFGSAFWAAFPAGPYALAAVEALACGCVLAVLGALLPALKAARMHPIEAMRIDA